MVNMKIKRNCSKSYEELKIGEMFVLNNALYIKVNNNNNEFRDNSILLFTKDKIIAQSNFIFDHEKVDIPKKLKITVEEQVIKTPPYGVSIKDNEIEFIDIAREYNFNMTFSELVNKCIFVDKRGYIKMKIPEIPGINSVILGKINANMNQNADNASSLLTYTGYCESVMPINANINVEVEIK